MSSVRAAGGQLDSLARGTSRKGWSQETAASPAGAGAGAKTPAETPAVDADDVAKTPAETAAVGADDVAPLGTARAADKGTEKQPLLALDVTDEASVEACVGAIAARHGRLDVLVNNAGTVAGGVSSLSLRALISSKVLLSFVYLNFLNFLNSMPSAPPPAFARRPTTARHFSLRQRRFPIIQTRLCIFHSSSQSQHIISSLETPNPSVNIRSRSAQGLN